MGNESFKKQGWNIIRVRPFRGRYLTRRQAKEINDMLLNAQKPDRTALKKEAEEFIEEFKVRRAREEANEENEQVKDIFRLKYYHIMKQPKNS